MTSVTEDEKKSEPSYIADGNVKWCTHGENNLAVPQKVKCMFMLSYDPATPHTSIYLTEIKTCSHSPGWVARVVGASSHTPKAYRFNSWSGHIPRL